MNPAALLHARLAQYRTPDGDAILYTRWHLEDDVAFQLDTDDRAALLEAADWLRRIDRLIEALDRTGHRVGGYRRNYVIWVNSAFAIGKSWLTDTGYSPEDVCPLTAMESLESLAGVLDLLTPGLDSPAHAQLVDLVTRVSAALDGDDTLSEQLRIHLRRVVDHLRACVEHPEAYDLNDVAEAVDDVITAAKAAAEESSHSSTWKKFWETFHACYVAPTVAGLIAGYGPGTIHAVIEAGRRLLSS